jgi:ABC-type transport system involved in cytochrome bd biosynthesis fused ATPase/permease subunit
MNANSSNGNVRRTQRQQPQQQQRRNNSAKSCCQSQKQSAGAKNWLDSFTKIAVAVILANALAWVWCSYGLAFIGRYEIAESLSETAITAILGTFIAYAVKSVLENLNKYGINLHTSPNTVPKTETTTTTTTTTTNNNRDY